MNVEEIRRLLKEDKATIGTWLQLPSSDVAEIMSKSGYDWVAVDLEHASFGQAMLPNIFRAIECGNAAPFARLPEANKIWIKAALEAGCQGLIFPMIESAAQLNEAINLATYPGQDYWAHQKATAYRGVGFCRANDFGKTFEHYHQNIAPQIFIAAQIEHIAAVDQIDAILSHKRLDAIMVGPYDLSGSMGLTGQFGHPDFQAAMTRITAACKRHGIAMGAHVVQPDPAKLQEEIDRGCRFLAYGIDSVFLWQASQCPKVKR